MRCLTGVEIAYVTCSKRKPCAGCVIQKACVRISHGIFACHASGGEKACWPSSAIFHDVAARMAVAPHRHEVARSTDIIVQIALRLRIGVVLKIPLDCSRTAGVPCPVKQTPLLLQSARSWNCRGFRAAPRRSIPNALPWRAPCQVRLPTGRSC